MKRFFQTIALIIFVVSLSSCSHRLTGTWNIANYEVGAPDQNGVGLRNIGTITFNGNGSGNKNIEYPANFAPVSSDKLPFRWKQYDDKYVTIDGDNSQLAKTWIIIENKKNSQIWKSTDGGRVVQTLNLSK